MAGVAEVWVSDDPRVIEATEEHFAQFQAWGEGVQEAMEELGIESYMSHRKQTHQAVIGMVGPREVIDDLAPEWKWLKTKGYATPQRAAAKRWLKEVNEPAPGALQVGIPDLIWLPNMRAPGSLVEVLEGRAWCIWSAEGVWDELFDENGEPHEAYAYVFEHGWSKGLLSEYHAAKEAQES